MGFSSRIPAMWRGGMRGGENALVLKKRAVARRVRRGGGGSPGGGRKAPSNLKREWFAIIHESGGQS